MLIKLHILSLFRFKYYTKMQDINRNITTVYAVLYF